MDYSGKHILLLGLGESGLASARWLTRQGAHLTIVDSRIQPPGLERLSEFAPEARFMSYDEPFPAALLEGMDAVVVSPGLKPGGALHQIVAGAAERALPVVGEVELFAEALAMLKAGRDYQPKILAVTGTNGKTTVTRLTGLLCERAGLRTAVAGNISPSVLDVLCDAIDADILPQVWVLELSSFQLHTTATLEADAAALLNITQDHLDWHGEMSDYAADKARIFSNRTLRVLNRDDALVRSYLQSAPAGAITFGSDTPDRENALGLCEENGMRWLTMAVRDEEAAEQGERKRRRKNEPVAEVDIALKRLMPADALRIRGQHNALNAMAALALCRAIDLPLAPLLHALREYEGEPHRVALIATVDQVQYIDDSKGTNVGATVAALNGLGQADAPHLLLIAGGDGKGQDFSPLAAPVARFARKVLLIGKDAVHIEQAITESCSAAHITIEHCETLPQAVERAALEARPGDCVLLSPACASLDMFRHYEHRAQVFADAVQEIALQRGEVVL